MVQEKPPIDNAGASQRNQASAMADLHAVAVETEKQVRLLDGQRELGQGPRVSDERASGRSTHPGINRG